MLQDIVIVSASSAIYDEAIENEIKSTAVNLGKIPSDSIEN